MPLAPPRPCRVPGCPALIKGGGYCEQHKDRAPNRLADTRRGSSSARGYDVHWQRIRAQFLNRHPLCGDAIDADVANRDGASRCRIEGRVTPAAVVDHIVPLSAGGTNEHRNLRALCKRDHDARTMRDQVNAPRST